MKKTFSVVIGLISHLSIVLAVMMITFYVTDRYNRPMAFINNDLTKMLMLVMSILIVVQSVYIICVHRRKQMTEYKKALEENGADRI